MKIKLLLSFFLIHTFLIVNAATPPNATIAYNSPICISSGVAVVIFSGTTGGTFSASPSGLSIDAATGSINPNQSMAGTYLVTYTIPPGIDPMFETSTTVTINNNSIPQFPQIAPICVNSQATVLPTISTNGIDGTWSPSEIDTQTVGTFVYVFTPNVGQCADFYSFVITILPATEPIFSFTSTNVCVENVPVLPTTSVNGISGTWSPSTVTTSGTYTFTPDVGQCAMTTVKTFAVNPAPTAMFLVQNMTVCAGATTAITIIGTPNAVVVYTVNGSSNQSVVLDSSGMAVLTTPLLSTSTVMCLISAESWSGINCTTPLSSCCVITVVPSVSILPIADVTVCGEYILPVLPVGNYFTQPGGSGTMLNAGDAISSTQTIYVFAATATTPSCVSEDSFQVTIIPAVSPTISTVDNINYIIVEDNQIVQTLQLNTEVQSGNYEYQWIESQNDIIGAISPSYTVNTVFGNSHNYAVRVTNFVTNCVTESTVFQVLEIPVPAPVGNPNQTFTPGQTLADIVVSGSNIQWYDSFNRGANPAPLPLSTVLLEGVTYYATQTINGYESASTFEITINFLANDAFAFKDLKFSPNPVRDVLHVESKDMIKDVTVFNIMGQKMLQQKFDKLDVRLQLSQLKAGNYFIKLESDNKSQVIKVIKE